MSRNIEAPISIRQQGLDNYLDETATIHGGYGYKDFVAFNTKLSASSVARLFLVSKQTVYKWRKIHDDIATE